MAKVDLNFLAKMKTLSEKEQDMVGLLLLYICSTLAARTCISFHALATEVVARQSGAGESEYAEEPGGEQAGENEV